jgi:hypothetical protein
LEKVGDRRYEDIEAALCQIPDIRAVRILSDEEGHASEVHVLATRDKAPKQLARDIQSLAMAQFGVDLDHRVISIVQFDDPDSVCSKPSPRPAIGSLVVEKHGLKVRVRVGLSTNGTEQLGHSEGPASVQGRLRATARATLGAVSELLPDWNAASDVEHVEVIPVGRHRIAVALISLLTLDGEATVSGSAVVRNSEDDAVVRAVLDAVNRRLPVESSRR